jgi:hypothetical protein
MRATGLLCGWRRRSVRATVPLLALSLALTRPAFGVLPLPGAVPPGAPPEAPPAQPSAPHTGAAAAPGAAPPPYPAAPTPGAPAPGSTAPGGPPPPGYPYAPPTWPGVYVELHADNPHVRIDRVIDGGDALPVCATPCSRVLDRTILYIIEGDGVTPTSRFVLPHDRSRVTLDVHAGAWGQERLGRALAIGGSLFAFLGLTVVGNRLFNNDGQTHPGIGLIMLAIGIPVALTGLYLSSSARTSVASSSGATFSDARPAARKRPLVALTARGLEF